MTPSNIFAAAERSEWRAWLAEHYKTEKDVWFLFPMKAAGERSIEYNDAVEEALCFGWIDSTIKPLDATHRIQHFTPRRRGSAYSRPNVERLIRLDRQGLIMPEVRESVRQLLETPYEFPEDILAAIRALPEAWEFYQTQPGTYRRIRIAYIDDARKRPEEFHKRLAHFLKKTAEGKRIGGFGGIDRYYDEP